MSTSVNSSTELPDGYVRLPGSERGRGAATEPVGPADPDELVTVTICLRRRPDGPPVPSFDSYALGGGRRHGRLALDVFAARYGAHPDELEAVAAFARGAGLNVLGTHSARRTVRVRGSAAQLEQAFAVTLRRYRRATGPMPDGPRRRRGVPGGVEEYRGREGFIHVPAALADVIIGVFGLDNRRVTRGAITGDPPIVGTVTIPEVAAAYNFPAPGAGISEQTIGIITPAGGYGGYLQPDLDSYFSGIGLPSVQPIPISVDGFVNGTFALTTTADAPAGTSVLTFASTAGTLIYSSVTGAGIPQDTYVQAVTATTITLGNYDSSGDPIELTLPADVPAGTAIYINLDLETTQDLALSASAAPGARLAIYFSDDTESGWVDLVNRAIHPDPGDFPAGVNPPTVMSASWFITAGDDPDGLELYGISTGVLDVMSAAFADAAIQDVTICVAAGDFGSSSGIGRFATSATTNGGDGYAHTVYPASDPWVLSVGGTTLGEYQPAGSSTPEWAEYAWNDPFDNPIYPWGTTGGGVSDYFPLPSYQSAAGVPGSINPTITPDPADVTITPPAPFNATGRGVPDVAANASINTGYSGLFLGNAPSPEPGNGTSAAAPLWAGLTALLNSNLGYDLGFINPALYQIGSGGFCPINPLWPDPAYQQLAACPVDNSNNGIPGYQTGPGWDACTGWGSPNGVALLTALAAPSCFLIVDETEIGEAGVQAELASPPASFDNAFFVVVDNLSADQLGVSAATVLNPVLNPPTNPPALNAPPPGASYSLATVQPANLALFTSSPGTPQRFTFGYNTTFSNTTAFPGAPGESVTVTIKATVTATVAGQTVTVTGTGLYTLTTDAAPFFAGGSATSWLSADLRVFQVEPGPWTLPALPGASGPTATGVTLYDTGDPGNDATTFIQAVITAFNTSTAAPPHHPFDAIATGEDASSLDTLPTDPSTHEPVYNFAVARVRYSTTGESARAARVFFRLIPALSVSTAYDELTTYRRWSNGVEFGEAIPLPGIDPSSDDVVTIPCFAAPRVDAATVSLTTQTDAANVQLIAPPAGCATESYAYYGCWLDLNQPAPAYPATLTAANLNGPFAAASLQTVQTLLRNQHQCLVAEIAFDPDPTEEGFAPTFTGPLAQRNLSLVPAANPGELGSRRVANTFILAPPAAALKGGGSPAGSLMIDWGNLPAGSTASLYWPTVDAGAVYDLAAASYANGARGLEILDPHTLQTTVGGIGYIPIPPGTDVSRPGLVSVQLPYGIRAGQTFTVKVRQLAAAAIDVDRVAVAGGSGERRIAGAFQLTIPVRTKATMLASEERWLAVARWIGEHVPAGSPWAPVFARYVEEIADRVAGLGGDPGRIGPSPTGGVSGCRHHQPRPVQGFLRLAAEDHGERFELFGEFDGFLRRP
jgi:Pro-kumamolisin, activation domain